MSSEQAGHDKPPIKGLKSGLLLHLQHDHENMTFFCEWPLYGCSSLIFFPHLI